MDVQQNVFNFIYKINASNSIEIYLYFTLNVSNSLPLLKIQLILLRVKVFQVFCWDIRQIVIIIDE
jgi:hypothetical protein